MEIYKAESKTNHTYRMKEYVRNIIFGVEDGLVSTVGLLAGIASGGVPKAAIVLTGLVLIMVEAFSMGVGSLLSEHSVEEYESRREVSMTGSLGASVLMFFSYVLAGLLPLLPYLFVAERSAMWVSVGLTLVALFMLGAISARYFHIRQIRHGLEMLILGGMAIGLGILVAKIFHFTY